MEKKKSFKADELKKLGGCDRGEIEFRKKYGTDLIDLSTKKNDLLYFLEGNRANLLHTFCLMNMTDQNRSNFYIYVLQEAMSDFPKGDINNILKNIYDFAMAKKDDFGNILELLEKIKKEINLKKEDSYEERRDLNGYRGVIKLINAIENDEKFAPRLSLAIDSLVEAYCYSELVKDRSISLEDIKIKKYKHYAHYAMKLTGIWPFE